MKQFKAHQVAVFYYRTYRIHRVMPFRSMRIVFRVFDTDDKLVGKFFDGYGPNGYRTFIDKRLMNEQARKQTA